MFLVFWHRPMVSHTRDLYDAPGDFYPCQARPQSAEGYMPERCVEHRTSYIHQDTLEWFRV